MNRFRMLARWMAAAAVVALVTSGRPALSTVEGPALRRVEGVAAASPCEWDRIERVVAIADVHGAYEQFLEILRVAGVIDADNRWAGGATHFVQLGDVVDRGPDSRKVLDFLRRLERE